MAVTNFGVSGTRRRLAPEEEPAPLWAVHEMFNAGALNIFPLKVTGSAGHPA